MSKEGVPHSVPDDSDEWIDRLNGGAQRRNSIRRAGDETRDPEEAGDGSKGNKTRPAVFVDAQAMKDKIKAAAMKPTYDVTDFYHKQGPWQHIARATWFENMTLSVIAFNALWISIDTDNNNADMLLDAHAVFQVAEHAFCLYFSFEWMVRFLSFKRKRNGLKDAWFVFDSCLVGMMVVETWLMTICLLAAGGGGGNPMGNASILRMARLMRLSRMARMARLFRAMPELLILIKAMAASIRSCCFVFLLLTLMLYVFGIMFRQLAAGTQIGEAKFSSVTEAMHTLWLDGTLLDSTGDLVTALVETSYVLVVIFYLFLMLSALTVMNMLIGVLCEVVSAVAATEKEQLTVSFVKSKLQEILQYSGLDENGDGQISKTEFSKLLEFPEACKALESVGVDVTVLVDNIDFIFAEDSNIIEDDDEDAEEKVLSFEEFMELVLDMRGSNTATVKDIVELQKYTKRQNMMLRNDVRKMLTEFSLGTTASDFLSPAKRHSAPPWQAFSDVNSSTQQDKKEMIRCLRDTAQCARGVAWVDGKDTVPPPSRCGGLDLRARVTHLYEMVADLKRAADLEVPRIWESVPECLDLEALPEPLELVEPTSPPPTPPAVRSPIGIPSPNLLSSSLKSEVQELLREGIVPEMQRLSARIRSDLRGEMQNISESIAEAKMAEGKRGVTGSSAP